MAAQIQVEHFSHSDVHDAKESLIPSLELALVEYLDRYDGRILDGSAEIRRRQSVSPVQNTLGRKGEARRHAHEHVKVLIPVGVESAFDDTGRMGLLGVDGDDSEWIRKAEDVTLA